MSAALLGMAFQARLGSQTAKIVLLKLVDCCDDEGRKIFPSVATLAEQAECSTRTAQRWLRHFCAVGLLRLVREGGRGAGSTNCYEMDVSMLGQLRKPGYFAALAPADDAGEDEGENGADSAEGYAQDACPEGVEAGRNAEIRVSPCHPYSSGRVTPATNKGDTIVSPNPSRETLKPEREGAGAGDAGACAGEREPRHAADAGLCEGQGTSGRVTLDDFRKAWPAVGLDDQAKLEAAWFALPFDQRRAALDGVKPFLDALKAGGRKHPPASWNYLAQRRWLLIEAETAPKKPEPVFVKPWSDDWWAVLLRKCAAGQRAGLMVEWAQAGKGITLLPGDAPGRGEVEVLKPYLCEGPELEAWRPWFRARGAELPRLRGNFRVFLPGAAPPGAVVEQGDL